jgi:hypothetical protein
MEFALMFNVLEGGVIEPIKWGKENLLPERSIIVLDESNQVVWLWHGSKQGLVARRTALRQAESLKGHGYTVGKSIIGRDLKSIKEIDQRKIGRDPETDKVNEGFEQILTRNYQELDNYVVNFSTAGIKIETKSVSKPEIKPTPKPEVKPEVKPAIKPEVKPEVKPAPKPEVKPEVKPVLKPEPKAPIAAAISANSKAPIASEYETDEVLPSPKISKDVKIELPELKKAIETPKEEAKVAFVLKSVLNYFDDIWVSKKLDGTYSIEMMDGPVCQFSIKEGAIKFSANSFSGINPHIKTEIQKKFVELSKLI